MVLDGSDHYSIKARCDGYREAMASCGLQPRILLHREPLQFCEQRFPDIDVIAPPDAPDALVTYSSFGCLALLLAARERGWAPPVIATFDLASATLDGLPIQAWNIDYDTYAASALKMLDHQIERPGGSLPSCTIPFRRLDPAD